MLLLSNKHDLLFRYPLCTKILFIFQNKQVSTNETFDAQSSTSEFVHGKRENLQFLLIVQQ